MVDKKEGKLGGLLIVSGLLIGIGTGLLLDAVAAGTLIGLGLGFAAAYTHAVQKKKL